MCPFSERIWSVLIPKMADSQRSAAFQRILLWPVFNVIFPANMQVEECVSQQQLCTGRPSSSRAPTQGLGRRLRWTWQSEVWLWLKRSSILKTFSSLVDLQGLGWSWRAEMWTKERRHRPAYEPRVPKPWSRFESSTWRTPALYGLSLRNFWEVCPEKESCCCITSAVFDGFHVLLLRGKPASHTHQQRRRDDVSVHKNQRRLRDAYRSEPPGWDWAGCGSIYGGVGSLLKFSSSELDELLLCCSSACLQPF